MKHMLDKLSGRPDEEDDQHAEAKMQVLHELRNMAMNMMGDKVKDRMPMGVEVAAPDAAGLKKGLDLAKSVIPKSLNADRDSSFGEHLDSKLPHMGSNGSDMDHAAGEVEGREALGRHEPAGDQGEPDQSHRNEEYSEMSDDDDMSHEEIDSMIEELQAKKRAKSGQSY